MAAESPRPLQDLLDRSAERIERLSPAEAAAAVAEGALLVDIRSDAAREQDGVVPRSLHVPRTVLEWRLEPDGEDRSPYAAGPDDRIIILCDHGYSSILAAATLADLGFSRVGDVVGGFEAWRDAGLPIRAHPTVRPAPGERPGMGPPEPA
jgi:rhodanese-related sulfurtransferase